MKKIVRLTESGMTKLIKNIIEQEEFVVPGENKTGDFYYGVNTLIDEFEDVDKEELLKVLENIVKGLKAEIYREKRNIGPHKVKFN